MYVSCAGSGGATLGAGVGDGRVGAVDIDADAGDGAIFEGIAGIGPPTEAGDGAIPYEAAGDCIAYGAGDDMFDGEGDDGTLVGIGDGALTTCGAAIGSSFCPLFDSLPLPLPLLE